MKPLIILLTLLFVMSFISATDVTLSPSSISSTLTQGQSTQVTIGYTANNPSNNSDSVSVSLNNAPSFVSVNSNLINIPANSQISGNLIFSISPTTLNPAQTYSSIMSVGNTNLPSTIIVNPDLTGQCRIYIPPTTSSKTLASGETATQSIQVTVSQYCSTPLQVTTNQPQMTKPISWNSMTGQVNPAQSLSMIITYDTTNVQKGTYADTIVISGIDGAEKFYTLSIPLSLTVSTSISPVTNGSFSYFPVCSVSGSELSLNSSYKLSCTDIPVNLKISPQIDTNFIEGINVEEIGNTYTYFFKPKSVGNTEIFANFLFGTANIGNPFKQALKIFQGNTVISGANMSFRFAPELYQAQENENIIVRVIDTATGNILSDAKILLDLSEVNNDSISLQSGKNYEIRASNYGYPDLVQSISLVSKPIEFNLSASYKKNDILDFTTNPTGAIISLNDGVITLPFTITEAGKFNITASLNGYSTTTKEIFVDDTILIIYQTPPEQVKKGGNVALQFDKESILRAEYYNSKKQIWETIIPEKITQTEITFETAKDGNYQIYSDEVKVKEYLIGEAGVLKWYQGKWGGIKKLWILIGGGFLILLFVLSRINLKGEDNYDYNSSSGQGG
ncbi:MAG: hypothetical protein AABY22_16880 [Nanoarchaeota archaeon]